MSGKPKIDLSGLELDIQCPFRSYSTVRCIIFHKNDPRDEDQYLCKCWEKKL